MEAVSWSIAAMRPFSPPAALNDPAALKAVAADAVPEPARSTLLKMRAMIRAAAGPEATETISYGMPSFRYKGALVGYAAFAKHCSFFPMNSSLIEQFGEELAGYSTAKGTIRFPLDKPLPAPLVKKIAIAAKVLPVDQVGTLAIQWPRMFQPTPDEVFALVQAFALAVDPLSKTAPGTPGTAWPPRPPWRRMYSSISCCICACSEVSGPAALGLMLVRMLTTAGPTVSTRPVKSGRPRTAVSGAWTGTGEAGAAGATACARTGCRAVIEASAAAASTPRSRGETSVGRAACGWNMGDSLRDGFMR